MTETTVAAATVPYTMEMVRALASPNAASPIYLAALEPVTAAPIFEKYGVTSPLVFAHFFANVWTETGALRVLMENMNYTHAERIRAVWPSRFPTDADARQFVNSPHALAAKVYGNRADLGNKSGVDGWMYIGRGMGQMTGRAAYERVGKALAIDLVTNPSLCLTAANALPVALEDWSDTAWLRHAAQDDVRGTRQAINGGLNGIDECIGWLGKWKAALGIA